MHWRAFPALMWPMRRGIPCGMIPLQRGIPCETLYLRRTVLFGEDKEIKLTIVEFNMSASSPLAP